MSNRKYKLETAACTDLNAAIRAIFNYDSAATFRNFAKFCLHQRKEVKDVIDDLDRGKKIINAFENGELEADPEDPNYPILIDDLNSIGVEVYDTERIQLPKFEGVNYEPTSYT